MKWFISLVLVLSLFVPTFVEAACTQKAATPLSDTLTWDQYPVTADTINILRGTVAGGPYSKIGSVAASLSTYADSTVQLGTYYYVINAQDALNQVSLSYSNEVCVTFNAVPTAPTGLKVQ